MQNPHIPVRSSKVSEKLVLLPETTQKPEDEDDEDDDELKARQGYLVADDDDLSRPPRDSESRLKARMPTTLKEKSYAERLPKSSRTEKLPRVTAYCTAQAYRMRATAEFVRLRHGAKTKLYDDCLYTVYHLPLLPGNEGYRIQSSPVLKSAGGKSVLDEEIERNERHEYREGFFGEESYGVRGGREGESNNVRDANQSLRDSRTLSDDALPLMHDPTSQDEDGRNETHQHQKHSNELDTSSPLHPDTPPLYNTAQQLANNLTTFAEMFIYSHGVVVFWNLTEKQEKDILADLTFSSSPSSPTYRTGTQLAVRPLLESDFETEEFHFEYNPQIPRPRLFNDMITLRSGDHMIKLAMSHAIAQSTKLSFFEERMADTMAEAQNVPRRLALRGELGMRREEVVRMLGKLFVGRVDVNLCEYLQSSLHRMMTNHDSPTASNMLDVPNFFWDSEPTLHPLYIAVREYLEIKPRVQAMNERCRVFLDLAEILSDSIADRKMSRLTWIIIVLIVLSILVTTFEVFLRFGILSTSKTTRAGSGASQCNCSRIPSLTNSQQTFQQPIGMWTPGSL